MAEILILGCGYSGLAIARAWQKEGLGKVSGTTRERFAELQAAGIMALDWADRARIEAAIKRADAILLSMPPPDAALMFSEEIAAARTWLGYLSSTSVYGDHEGRWVDENTPPTPLSARAKARLEAEKAWQAHVPEVNIFRLSGIYGPKRNVLERLKAKTARNLEKPGQVFGRIHVDDIARIVVASFLADDKGEIYNVSDDLPSSSQEVLAYGAALCGLDLPEAKNVQSADISEMAREFYAENKRVRNDKIRQRFGALLYPDFRAGLDAIWAQMNMDAGNSSQNR